MSDQRKTLDLAVAIGTKNNIRTIELTVRSVLGLAHRILVVESGSTDGTIELCRSLGAEIIEREWPGYAKQRQFMLAECHEHAWILLLDSDESLTPQLRDSIRETVETNDPKYNGWELNRKIWFLGKQLEHTFQPEWRMQLVRGGKGRVRCIEAGDSDSKVQLHEVVEAIGNVGRLKGDLLHDSWADLPDMFRRHIEYGQLAVVCGARGGSIWRIIFSPPAAFTKQLILKRGFLDGRRGVLAAAGMAVGTCVKHVLIHAHRAGLDGEGEPK